MSFNLALIAGVWYNELGSSMNFTVDETGLITGVYISAVGTAEDTYPLAGRFDAVPPANTGVSIGWTVTFANNLLNAHSTSTWSGQFFRDGQDRILTHWLLSTSTSSANSWDSTNVGTDVFTRNKPTAQEIATTQARGFASPRPEHVLAKRHNRKAERWAVLFLRTVALSNICFRY